MSDDLMLALLHRLAEEDGQSLPRMAKRLQLSASELHRLLTELGDAPHLGGLDLIEQRREGERVRLWLTSRGRALCMNAERAFAAKDQG